MAALWIAFGLCAVLIPPVTRAAVAVGAVDIPGEERRVHTHPTPRMGGLGVYLSMAATSLLAAPLTPEQGMLLAGGALTVALGVTDDVYSLPPLLKLLGQATVALLPVSAGVYPMTLTVRALSFALSDIGGAVFSFLLTVALMNAVNMIDGLDGLAVGCVLPGVLVLGAAGAPSMLALAGALLGFYLYNAPPARIFLGDSGSMLLGYAMAFGLLDGRAIFPMGWLLVAAVPLADLLFAVVRRILTGKNPLLADGGHLHHRLLHAGLSTGRTALSLTVVSVALALIAPALPA